MNFREELKIFWELRSRREKLIVAGLVILIIVGFVSGWFTTFKSWNEVRKFERAAQTAKRDAENALGKAQTIAEEIRERETKLAQQEEKLNEKQIELDKANKTTADARADYDRAVREPIKRTPGADELCAELAKLGYPCR